MPGFQDQSWRCRQLCRAFHRLQLHPCSPASADLAPTWLSGSDNLTIRFILHQNNIMSADVHSATASPSDLPEDHGPVQTPSPASSVSANTQTRPYNSRGESAFALPFFLRSNPHLPLPCFPPSCFLWASRSPVSRMARQSIRQARYAFFLLLQSGRVLIRALLRLQHHCHCQFGKPCKRTFH